MAETDLAEEESCRSDERPVLPAFSAVERLMAQSWEVQVALCWAVACSLAALC